MDNAVFLPGFALNKSMYTRLDVFKGSVGIDIIPNSSWNETLDDIARTIPAKSLVIGYSMGARLALGLALERPETTEALILISGHAGLADDKEREERIEADTKLSKKFKTDSEGTFKSFDTNPIFDDTEGPKNQISDRINDVDLISNQLDIMGLGKMPNYEERLIELRIPVLYLSGSRDLKYTQLNARYKKKTPFSHHRVLDSDHRLVQNNPMGIDLNIKWFAENFY